MSDVELRRAIESFRQALLNAPSNDERKAMVTLALVGIILVPGGENL